MVYLIEADLSKSNGFQAQILDTMHIPYFHYMHGFQELDARLGKLDEELY
jgi:hypothetical protein